MTANLIVQRLPASWSEREKLRQKGQFWTPAWVAEAMITYVAEGAELVFDPAVGKGSFFFALEKFNTERTSNIAFYGTDNDRRLISEASQAENFASPSCTVEVKDFITDPPRRSFKAIVANPPYIRHHRLSSILKSYLRDLSVRTIGEPLDGRAGLHIYFLLRALTLLDDNGKLAFIMPADTCEGVFAKNLWQWITRNFCLECVVTFVPTASPFPEVDTNPLIFLIKKAQPRERIWWVQCLTSGTPELRRFVESRFRAQNFSAIRFHQRSLSEALQTGLSRPPQTNGDSPLRLSDFARVMRGIATGANDFFFLTEEVTDQLKIPHDFLVPAIGRTRDVEGSVITETTLAGLSKKGRPTLLFSPDGRSLEAFPRSVKEYLEEGRRRGLPKRALISTRRPWYKMERRDPPPFLFAYLGRRNARFIKNVAHVVPLTSFLCVYPHSRDGEYVRKLWALLQHPQTVGNLPLVGKSYGAGAIKVEPRALERLPIPTRIAEEVGIEPVKNVETWLPLLDD